MAIPQSFIQDLLSRADVVETIGRFVTLKKGGANYMGLCPFHGEKSPSFSVSPTKQFYHCFGCGKNGNAIGFLMDFSGMTFVEAVHELAQQHGMPVPDDRATGFDRALEQQKKEQRQNLTATLEQAALAYAKQLKLSQAAVAYLKKRGLSGEVAKRFGLGYSPEGWRFLATIFPDYQDLQLEVAGLVIVNEDDEKRYDRFRNRIMFPIRNVKGECIGFGGRVLGDEKPKYLNSPETPVFSKGHELYGLFEAKTAIRQMNHVLITEGYMDVVALAQLGFPNAVATLGTACTGEHLQKLVRHTNHLVFSFDGDEAGRRAASKALAQALPLATDERSIKFLFLPPEHDPDSFVREHGADAFAQAIRQATPLSRYLLDTAQAELDLHTAEGRAQLSSRAKPLWTALPDGALKQQLLSELAALTHLSAQALHNLWVGDAPPSSPHPKAPGPSPKSWKPKPVKTPSASRPSAGASAPLSRSDHVARILLSHAELWNELSPQDHQLLAELQPPHGPLMIWLEGQIHNEGPMAWSDLLVAMSSAELRTYAMQLFKRLGPASTLVDSRPELFDLLKRIHLDQLHAQSNQALEKGDLDEYKRLMQLGQQLRAQPASGE